MKLFKNLFEPFIVNMRINLSSSNINMSEHFLYAPQVCAASQQVGCETVSECVNSQIFGQTCARSIFFNEAPDFNTTKRPACSGQKKKITILTDGGPDWASAVRDRRAEGQFRAEVLKIITDSCDSGFAEGNNPFASALSDTAEITDIKVQIGDFKAGKLAGTDTGGIEQLEEGLIAIIVWFFGVWGVEQLKDLRFAADGRKPLPKLWGIEDGGKIFLEETCELRKAQEHFY